MSRVKRALSGLSIALWALAGVAAAEAAVRARIAFIGDIMVHWEQIEAARRSGSWDFKPPFRRIGPLLEDALVVGNLETVFAGEESGYGGYPSFNAPDALAEALAGLGVGVVTLANNHILDRGAEGALRTTAVLDAAGIRWVGLGSEASPGGPLLVEWAGLRWVFVNYCDVRDVEEDAALGGALRPNRLSEAGLREGMAEARTRSPDVVVACFHWGEEYRQSPTPRQRAFAAIAAEAGADLVIGTHPHVLQPIEFVVSKRGKTPVAYSLGNFISNQRRAPRERGAVLAADFELRDDEVRFMRLLAAPIATVVAWRGRHGNEVVYAGEHPRFSRSVLDPEAWERVKRAGEGVLRFWGAVGSADREGFYSISENL